MKKYTEIERKALIDELGALDVEIKPLEDKKKRATEIRSQLRELYSAKPGNVAFTSEGLRYTATVGVMGNERYITSMQAVFDKLTPKVFVANCGFTLKKLGELLTASDVNLLTTTARTGSRQIDTFLKTK